MDITFPLPDWIDRLGWVLVHFLWEGALIGIGARVACMILKNANARIRYGVLGAAMAVCALAPVFTWFVLLPEDRLTAVPTASQSVTALTLSKIQPSGPMTMSLAAQLASPDSPTENSIEAALPCFVTLWIIGVLYLSAQLITGWMRLRRLRAASSPVQNQFWITRFANLAEKLGMSRAILFLESPQVEVPIVFGWFKPVLLVPAAFFTLLPVNQVEAILAHELAHIRRHDYVFNLLQIVIETLLFYHPAVWWIGRAIRQERENCCDDEALEMSGDNVAYASALAALEQNRLGPMSISMAVSGGSLLQRVRRILGNRPSDSSLQARFAPLVVAVIGSILLGAGAYAFAAQAIESDEDPFGNVALSQGSPDEIGRYQDAFRNAVIGDKVGLAEAFLRHGMKLEPIDIKSGAGDILADAVYFSKDPRMIRMLLHHGAKPAGNLHDWRSTINHALRLGNKEIVDVLIAAGATCDLVWYDAALGQLDDLKKRDARQPLDVKSVNNALDRALATGQASTFDWLWAKAKKPDATVNKAKLASFYNRAAEDGHLPFLLHLERMGVKPIDGGAKALASAVGGNHLPEAKHLFDLGATLPSTPAGQRSPLINAAGEGRLEMVRLLLDHGADINARDESDNGSMTALCWAGYSGHDDVCQLLVERGADLNIADDGGRTAAWYVAGSTHSPGALEMMLKKGIHINWVDSKGGGLLENAMNFSPCQLGLTGFPGNMLTPAEQRDYDAREERTMDLLISAGLDPNGKEGTETPLKTLFISNHYPAARALLRHLPDLNVKDAQGNPAITYLFSNCHTRFPLDVLATLLNQGADPNGSYPIPGLTPQASFTVLQTALGSFREPGDAQITDPRAAVALLIQHGAKFPGVKNDIDQALLLAAAKGDLAGLKYGLAKGASADVKDSFGYSPTLISINLRFFDNAFWLLDHGSVPAQNMTMWGGSLLPAAVAANRLDMVKLLLAKGVNPQNGPSGLNSAVELGNQRMFDTLLKAGANPQDANIFTCIQYNQPKMGLTLLDRGVDPQPKPFMENRANVYWAVCYNQPEILKGLLDRGADPTMIDAFGETPLSEAKQFHKEMVPWIEAAIARHQGHPPR